jgi:phosphoglycerate dehydrogenase-like enzyme
MPTAPRPGLSRFTIQHADIADLCDDVEAIMGWVVESETIRASKALKILLWMHSGCNDLDLDLLSARGVHLCNVSGANSIAVAEHAMALMLGLAKRVVQRDKWVKDALWQPLWHPDYIATTLAERTLLVVGLGQVGSAVARRAKAFNMKVIGVRRNPGRGCKSVDRIYGPKEFHAALGEADFVILALPLTHETANIMDRLAFDSLKSGARLINVARGALIDLEALYDALKDGRLAEFGTDCWWHYQDKIPQYHYPIPEVDLVKLPNVIATAGQASSSDGVKERLIDFGIESLAAFVQGKPVPRTVDPDLGY